MSSSDVPLDQDLMALIENQPDGLASFLEDVHAADLAQWARYATDQDLATVFGLLDVEARVDLFHFAEDKLAARLVALLDIEGIVRIIEVLGADEAVDGLALIEGEDRGNRLDAQRLGDLRLLVDVDLDHLDGAASFADQFLKQWPELLARAAPGRPKINQYGFELARF